MTNPQSQPEKELERILIELYESAMLHGEAQANGVLPTSKQRDQTVLIALNEVAEQVKAARIKELQNTLDNSSGGGSWRRVIITRISELEASDTKA